MFDTSIINLFPHTVGPPPLSFCMAYLSIDIAPLYFNEMFILIKLNNNAWWDWTKSLNVKDARHACEKDVRVQIDHKWIVDG